MAPRTRSMRPTSFFSLPRELRDAIYAHYAPYKWNSLIHMKHQILQPNTSFVSKQMREESLDIFYGGKAVWYLSKTSCDFPFPCFLLIDFSRLLDLREWQHTQDYPPDWTPDVIFRKWIHAIGDQNAARLKRLIIYVMNFKVVIVINKDAPRITAKITTTRPGYDIELAEDAPKSYGFKEAMVRAEERLRFLVDGLNAEVGWEDLRSRDFQLLHDFVESVKPALCSRNGIGWKGAVLREADVVVQRGREKEFAGHRAACAACSYRRAG